MTENQLPSQYSHVPPPTLPLTTPRQTKVDPRLAHILLTPESPERHHDTLETFQEESPSDPMAPASQEPLILPHPAEPPCHYRPFSLPSQLRHMWDKENRDPLNGHYTNATQVSRSSDFPTDNPILPNAFHSALPRQHPKYALASPAPQSPRIMAQRYPARRPLADITNVYNQQNTFIATNLPLVEPPTFEPSNNRMSLLPIFPGAATPKSLESELFDPGLREPESLLSSASSSDESPSNDGPIMLEFRHIHSL
jgi:hypothetical protein